MASSRVELAVALEVVRSAVADGDDLAPLFRAWSGLERQAITKAIANSAVTGGAMPSTAPTASSADPRAEPLSSSDHGPHWAQGGAAARTAPTRWAHRAVGGQARGTLFLFVISSWFLGLFVFLVPLVYLVCDNEAKCPNKKVRSRHMTYDEPEWPNEGACFRYMINRNRQLTWRV